MTTQLNPRRPTPPPHPQNIPASRPTSPARPQEHPGAILIQGADDNLLLRPMSSMLTYLRHRMQLLTLPIPRQIGAGAMCMPSASSSDMIEHCKQTMNITEATGATVHDLAFGSTDRYLIIYDPNFAASLRDVEEVMYVLCHEIGHRMFCDPWWLARVQADGSVCGVPFQNSIAQKALDARVNSFLDEMNEEAAKAGLKKLPCGKAPKSAYLHPDITWHDTQDQAYLKLYKDDPDQGQEPDDNSEGDPSDNSQSDPNSPPPTKPGNSQGWGECHKHEQQTIDEQGNTVDAGPHTPEFQNSEDTARAAAQASAQRAMGRGHLPLGIGRGLLEILRPPYDASSVVRATIQSMLPGTSELNGMIDQRGQVEIYRQRKHIRTDPRTGRAYPMSVPPALITEQTELVVGIADTSGSMGQKDLQRAFSAAADILEKGQPQRTILIQIDAAVAEVRDVADPTEFGEIEVKGGGGTDMRVAFDEIDRMIDAGEIPIPSIVVIGTDGETPWCEDEKPYPVLAMITRPTSFDAVPDWMEKVLWPVEGE